jgi:signal transduction histidine kinase
VNVEPSGLRGLVDQAVQHTSGELDAHPVVRKIAPVLVLADRATFLRVMENLLTNAAKFSEPGTPAEITTEVSGDHVVVAVRDHGVGIPEAEQGKIFERFYRVSSTAQTTAGTGIGLAIVKQFTEAQGGTVSVRTPADGGSEFRLRLRRAAS